MTYVWTQDTYKFENILRQKQNVLFNYVHFFSESLSQTFAGPCGPLSCKFGSTCREVGDRFSCSCIQRCPPVGWLPVCGTDGVTYASPCFLELFSCRQQKQINIAKEGSCKPGTYYYYYYFAY